jgi:NADH:ubiquinone oxidoreductase subunit 2 (subunit N)
MYWSLVGIGLVLTMALGIVLMVRTNKLGRSFLWSSVLNVLFFAGAAVWWSGQAADTLQRNIGIAFYGIAFVNVAAFDLFALASMRKQPPGPEKAPEESS